MAREAPIASLFLATGVRDAGSIVTLTRLERKFRTTRAEAIALADALGLVQGRLAGLTAQARGTALLASNIRGATAATRQFNAASRQQTRMAPAVAAPLGRTRSGRPRGPVSFGGGLGVGGAIGGFAAIAGLGAAGRGIRSAAELESASIAAAFAGAEPGTTPGPKDFRRFQRESLALSSRFNLGVGASSQAIREAQQLGIKDQSILRGITEAGAAFNVVEPTIAAEDASAAIFRLIKSTTRSREEFLDAGRGAIFYANAIKIAGDESAAGAASVFEMVREFQPVAKLAGANADQIIAFSGALSDLNDKQRELFRTALLRVTGKAFQDQGVIGGIVGELGPDKGKQFTKLLESSGFEALIFLVRELRDNPNLQGNQGAILNALGFANVRDRVLLQNAVNSLDKYDETLRQINDASTGPKGSLRIMDQTREQLASLEGSWRGVTSALDRFTSTTITRAAPALKGLMQLIRGTLDSVTQNPILGTLLPILGFGLAGRAIGRTRTGQRLFGRFTGRGSGGVVGRARRGGISVVDSILLADMFRGSRGARGSRGLGKFFSRFGRRFRGGAAAGRNAGLGARGAKGAGLLTALFKGGGTKTALNLAGRGAFGRVALGAAGFAAGPVGIVTTILGLMGALSPLFRTMGDFFENLGNKGGIIGMVFKTMSLTFNILGAAGDLINKVFGKIIDFFTSGPFEKIGNFINKMGDWVSDKLLDPAIDFFDDDGSTSGGEGGPAGLRGGGGGVTVNMESPTGDMQSIFDSAAFNAGGTGGAL